MKSAVVTGASTGIGREIAKGIARAGFRVVMVSRDIGRAAAAVEQVRAAAPGADVQSVTADLASLAEVRRAAGLVKQKLDRLDALVNCAAVVPKQRVTTPEGLESAFAANVLAPVVLVHELKQLLAAGAPSRVVNFYGGNHRSIDFDDLQFEKRKYKGWDAYGESKLCVAMITVEQARRLVEHGITVNCAWPGIVNTEGIRELTGMIGFMTLLMRPMMKTPEQGAAVAVWLATAPELERVSGKFFGAMRGDGKQEMAVPDVAKDLEGAKRLYEICERLAKI